MIQPNTILMHLGHERVGKTRVKLWFLAGSDPKGSFLDTKVGYIDVRLVEPKGDRSWPEAWYSILPWLKPLKGKREMHNV